MGGGKRNYNAMRAKHRQWKKTETPEPEEEKKEVSKEDKDALIALWEQSKEKNKKKTPSEETMSEK